jgi:cathepsin X
MYRISVKNYVAKNILNCQMGGSCNGGDHLATYKAIHEYGSIPYEDCMVYQACSSDSKEEACKDKQQFECTPNNICKTCDTFSNRGGVCNPILHYPNATIASYGAVRDSDNMMAEIYKNGPIACGINAAEIDDYNGGILDVPKKLKTINNKTLFREWNKLRCNSKNPSYNNLLDLLNHYKHNPLF